MGEPNEATEATPFTEDNHNEKDQTEKEFISQNGKSKHSDAAAEKEREAMLPQVAIQDGDTTITLMNNGPKDKFMVVYLILLLHGIGTLMPWNMFITATNYFTDYKLKVSVEGCGDDEDKLLYNSTQATTMIMSALNSTLSPNQTICDEKTSVYQNYFLSYLGFVAQVPNVLLNAINVFARVGGGSTSKRIIWSIIIIIVMFIFTVILAMIDSSEWPDVFFWVTMVTVVIINMANGVYQNSVYGTAAILPMKYTNAVVLGSNISGTLTSIIMLVSIAATPNIRTSAIYYFLTAILILLIAFDTYFVLPFLPFYRHHKERAEKEREMFEIKTEATSDAKKTIPFLYIFKKCWKQFIGVWFVFFVTLTCFPAIQANVKRVEGDGFPISEKYFQGFTCFLFFNFFAMVGNLVTEWVRKPGPRWVWLPILLRVLFIPFFMLCNFWPKSEVRGIPVLIDSNWAYVIGGILMAFSSGYFSSLTMMYAPRQLKEPEYQGTAGMMAAFFLITGIFSGVLFSLPVTIMVEKINAS